MKELFIIKIGSNVIDDVAMLGTFLDDFSAIQGHKILIHGGGKLATEMSAKLGIETKMADGRRITDEDTLRVVTMTYAGWVNKSITATLNSKGCQSLGLSGADVKLIPAVKRPVAQIDYGWVGDLLTHKINTRFIDSILSSDTAMIVAPITADADGHLLNVNADTIAQALAEAMADLYNTTLIYCFEKKGVLSDVNDEDSVVYEIDQQTAITMKEKGIISKGMIPKIDNALQAINSGVQQVVIGHAADIKMIVKNQKNYGTRISK